MVLAHFGVALFIIGTTIVSNHSVEKDLRMSLGESAEIGGHRFVFQGVTRLTGPNYTANRGKFQVFKGDEEVVVLEPEKRTYMAQAMPMTEAAIDWGLTRDLYVSLGENLGDGAWSVRLYYKPFMCWVWLGGLAMAFGGMLAVSDRRYRDTKNPKNTTTDTPTTENS